MMFKAFSLLLFFVISVNISQAQFRIGLGGELTSAKFGGNPPDSGSYESILGFGGSALIEYKIVKDVYLSFQPGYHTKGTKIKYGREEALIKDTIITYEINQSCISFPLNLKIYNNSFYIGGGVILDIISSATLKNEESGSEKDIKDRFTDIDLMADFNMGYEFTIGKPSLFIEFRYIQGLININESSNFTEGEIYKANFKSNGFSFLAGITYPFN